MKYTKLGLYSLLLKGVALLVFPVSIIAEGNNGVYVIHEKDSIICDTLIFFDHAKVKTIRKPVLDGFKQWAVVELRNDTLVEKSILPTNGFLNKLFKSNHSTIDSQSVYCLVDDLKKIYRPQNLRLSKFKIAGDTINVCLIFERVMPPEIFKNSLPPWANEYVLSFFKGTFCGILETK